MPLPSFWGGFRVSIEQIEFWQGGEHRLHDRFCTSAKTMRGRLIVLHRKRCKIFVFEALALKALALYSMSLSHLAKSRTGKGAVVYTWRI